MKVENVKVALAPEETVDTQVEEMPVVEGTLEEMIPVWKQKFGKIYKSTIDGDPYVWRKIKRKEYTNLMTDQALDGEFVDKIYLRQEKIAKLVVLYPYNIEQLIEESGGLATTIADEVIVKSGFELASTEEL